MFIVCSRRVLRYDKTDVVERVKCSVATIDDKWCWIGGGMEVGLLKLSGLD